MIASGPGPPSSAQTPSTRRRTVRAVVGLAIVVVLAVVSYEVGAHSQSERQAAARASAVPRTELTAPVKSQVLASSLVFRAVCQAGASAALTAIPALDGSPDPVVTKVPITRGSLVRAGQLLLEVAGQPIMALPGSLPSYRDLQVGDAGPDVTELQTALAQLRYLPSQGASGNFDVATARAVSALWAAAGYTAPTTRASATTSQRVARVIKYSIAFLPHLPADVSAVNVRRGSLLALGKPWASIRTGEPTIMAQIPATSAGQVRVGSQIKLFDDLSGVTATATIASLGAVTTATAGGQYVPAVVKTVGASPFAPGTELRAVATTASTGRSVLTVPSIAVHSAGDGSTYVVRVSGSVRTDVTVTIGLSADGYVQILSSQPVLMAGAIVLIN